jgi:hypothetical protein
MKHYELLKLVPGADPVEIQEKLWRGYRKLGDALDWLNHPVVYRSCRQEDDYDLMVVIEVDKEELLNALMDDPEVQKQEEAVKPFIHRRKIFNHY